MVAAGPGAAAARAGARVLGGAGAVRVRRAGPRGALLPRGDGARLSAAARRGRYGGADRGGAAAARAARRDRGLPVRGGGWQFPERAPVEVVCHGDFAPYNCVLRGSEVVGVIDFDTAHPGSRVWDVAYAAYRWVTLTRPDHVEALGSTAEQLVRVRLFCDAYGLDWEGRGRLADVAVERLVALVEHMRAQAAAGNAAFRGTWPPGTTGCTWRTSSTCGSTAGRSPGRCWSREARGCCGGRW
ncbi:phosphotransferase [Thermobifida cellulosilytica]|uniref:phosphotransferase n=1 Tax=Thermobifida cellulosilytica TaxID=144786 RepID=UPI001E2B5033|nr:phosphotransferase [Thermobifida cellulosilytica]